MDQISLTQDLAALLQVILIDITLAGDNAIVVGMAVAGLPDHQKRPAILLGILGATVIRIALGAIALQLLAIIGLMLAGGLLLLWVCWKMFRELRRARGHAKRNAAAAEDAGPGDDADHPGRCVDESGQRARRGRRGERPHLGAGARSVAVGGADGGRGQSDGPLLERAALDRLGGPGDRALRGGRDDLGWRTRGRRRHRP